MPADLSCFFWQNRDQRGAYVVVAFVSTVCLLYIFYPEVLRADYTPLSLLSFGDINLSVYLELFYFGLGFLFFFALVFWTISEYLTSDSNNEQANESSSRTRVVTIQVSPVESEEESEGPTEAPYELRSRSFVTSFAWSSKHEERSSADDPVSLESVTSSGAPVSLQCETSFASAPPKSVKSSTPAPPKSVKPFAPAPRRNVSIGSTITPKYQTFFRPAPPKSEKSPSRVPPRRISTRAVSIHDDEPASSSKPVKGPVKSNLPRIV